MVLVSHSHEFLFIKTGKTAGTSVEMYLEPFCRPPGARITERTRQHKSRYGIVGARMTGHGNALTRALFPWRNHMSAADIRARLGKRRWDRYARITTIRNPFDKALSQYLWKTRSPTPQTPEELADFRAAFLEHLASYRGLADHDTLHIDGSYAATMTIRYEYLQDDLAKVCQTLDLETHGRALPHTKRTRDTGARPLAAYYDPRAIDIVRDRYAWIFERFGYAPDPADPIPDLSHDITGVA
ncbi:sulfotransferase family 2 domain-containing protein [Oceanibium sediminis]|uniref:sulfotransferase family 2 domain-containing protein n=1 Tax=Oceanibium sediminis TaxID=2026339 RepID=UPI000DD3B4CD|nr:sulfotransferase family 2 domain-containing protein [Oceanibium sediminis]